MLYAGIAREIISPELGTLLLGYPGHRPGDSVADDLNSTALVLREGENTAAIVSLDLCLIDDEQTAILQTAIGAATGISPHAITLHTTHTHSGPVTIHFEGWGSKNQEYWDSVQERIVQSVVQAKQNCIPVRVGIGAGSTQVGINRREIDENGDVHLGINAWGPRDETLTVVRFEQAETNETVATLVHASAHPTARGVDAAISRDWPGVMIDRVEAITGAPVLFLNGASADVAPRTNMRAATGDGAPASQEAGLLAAGEAIEIWHNIKEWRDLSLDVQSTEFALPLQPLPPRDEAEQKRAQYDETSGDYGAEARERAQCDAVIEAYESGKTHRTRAWQQNITTLGPIALVPFGGEVMCEIALRLCHLSPFAHTLAMGNTNGSHGYLVTRESRGRGGYEVWSAGAMGPQTFADNIDDFLVKENLALLRKF